MKIIRSNNDFNEIFSVSTYPDEYVLDEKCGIREANYLLKSETLNEHISGVYIEGVNILFIRKSKTEDFRFFVRSDYPYLQMHFEFEGGAFYTAKDHGGIDCSIDKGEHCLFYFPALHGQITYPATNKGFSVEIEISLSFLKRALNDDLEILGDFNEYVRNERPVILGGKSFPITAKIKNLLIEMYDCPYVGQLKKLYIEGKLLELLCLQIAQITNKSEDSTAEKNHSADREQMAIVKDILHSSIDQPHSIEELARMIGMNRTKLQDNFKKTYGNTIFGYLSDLRMDQARNLLATEEYMKISEIARKIGYKNPNHFSTAFKKKFGTLPKLHKRF